MERLRTEQPKGLTREGLRKWGMLFLALGIFGRSILQTRFLRLAGLDNVQLLETLSAAPEMMLAATFAVILQFLECCAAPIFCLLLAEGFSHTSGAEKYIGRVLGVAVLSEIPYNLAMSANFLDFSSRNPAFGLAVSLILLYLYGYCKEKKFINLLIKIAATLAAVVWCGMLKIDDGICCVVLTIAFWAFRNKPMLRNLAGGAAAILCCIFSMSYLAAPMVVVILHFYNGEQGKGNRFVNYLFYPVLLTAFAIVGIAAFGF